MRGARLRRAPSPLPPFPSPHPGLLGEGPGGRRGRGAAAAACWGRRRSGRRAAAPPPPGRKPAPTDPPSVGCCLSCPPRAGHPAPSSPTSPHPSNLAVSPGGCGGLTRLAEFDRGTFPGAEHCDVSAPSPRRVRPADGEPWRQRAGPLSS
ncbi:uncharacterized protein LOC144456231 [Phascolarctos cinereus]